MRKNIIPFAVCALMLAGCKDYSYETWTPDPTLHRSGEVSLLVSFENLKTKVFMDEQGHGTWDGGDQIAVACSDGSFISFTLDGTGNTKRAVFKGNVPDGKSLGSVAVYPPSAAVSLNADVLTLNVPSSQVAAVSSAFPGVMVGQISEDWEVNMKQVLGFIKLTLDNFPGDAASISFSSDRALSGTFSAAVAEMLDSGLKASDTSSQAGLTLTSKSSGKKLYAMVPVPVADYPSIHMQLKDRKGEVLVEQDLSDYAIEVTRGELFDMNTYCADVPAPPCRVNFDGERIVMDETSPSVYEGEFEVPATASFTVELDGEPYGFATYSGAGGLGTIKSVNSALPVAGIRSKGKSNKTFYVKRSLGTMTEIEKANNPFGIDLESPGKMHLTVDLSDPGAPHYKMNLIETLDPSVIFHEDFDFCTLGGDYLAPGDGHGSTAATYDGYLPATTSPNQNNPGFTFDYPNHVSSPDALPAYLEAYGLKDWEFECAGERPSAMQLGTGSLTGTMTTPAFSNIDGSVDVVIEIEIARFSSSSTETVSFELLGAGKFTSAQVTRDAYASAKTGSSYPEARTSYTEFQKGGSLFQLRDDEYFPHSWDNADVDKPVSHYRLEASGLSSVTRLRIEAPKITANARCFIYDIKVTKK